MKSNEYRPTHQGYPTNVVIINWRQLVDHPEHCGPSVQRLFHDSKCGRNEGKCDGQSDASGDGEGVETAGVVLRNEWQNEKDIHT